MVLEFLGQRESSGLCPGVSVMMHVVVITVLSVLCAIVYCIGVYLMYSIVRDY